ncbi:MAG: flagellar type III secretion system protein FlhB [Paracoccus sp. (in: a-proteobacteria)]|uniref:flagellar type III secretion system protein FlhB n=1 Tax=Paracoccus sp. TaxID=267 RepID=UPI0026DF7D93|nr:flagellar type III secretion system protein FlhB [Paracoccus sp. (in: a-proteobacteria)]MDO5632018.1 flagellar type III secretion system protein FlhB [Paracoccus sp. (in: a-proteobacteria)]
MSEEDKDDKQFDASEQKIRKAREKGDIVRSTEVNAALMYLGAWVAFALLAGYAVRTWLAMGARAMGADGWPQGSVYALADSLWQFAAMAVLALVLVPGVTIIAGLAAQRSIVFAGKKIMPDIKKINPFANAKQKFGKSGLVQFAISLAKVGVVCVGGWYLFTSLINLVLNTPFMGEGRWVAGLGMLIGRVLLMALAISAVFAIIDYLWKRHEHLQKLRMSRKEMQDEHKDSEGDPHMKGARRQKAVDIVMSQMIADVAKADVVIVNPTHYAVALEWKRGSGLAPVCVAKGVDEIAAKIREKAKENNVPIWSDPPCARAIHATVKVGEEIHRDHFGPVAAAIRFAEKMRARSRAGW